MSTLQTRRRHDADTVDQLVTEVSASASARNSRAGAISPQGTAGTPASGEGRDKPLAFMPYRTLESDGSVSEGHVEREVCDAVHQSTGTGSNKSPKVAGGGMVRRLTPTECERLQGLPDGWTLLEESDEPNPLPDGRRYAACGDAVTANVSEWIGHRFEEAASA